MKTWPDKKRLSECCNRTIFYLFFFWNGDVSCISFGRRRRRAGCEMGTLQEHDRSAVTARAVKVQKENELRSMILRVRYENSSFNFFDVHCKTTTWVWPNSTFWLWTQTHDGSFFPDTNHNLLRYSHPCTWHYLSKIIKAHNIISGATYFVYGPSIRKYTPRLIYNRVDTIEDEQNFRICI